MDKETLAEKIHGWYLEASRKVKAESYNTEAQKEYKDLTEDQKMLDRYIAEMVLKFFKLK